MVAAHMRLRACDGGTNQLVHDEECGAGDGARSVCARVIGDMVAHARLQGMYRSVGQLCAQLS